MPQPITEARVYALFFQTIVGGIHLVIYAQCLLYLFTKAPRYYHWRNLSDINWLMVAVSTALCFIGMAGMGLAFYHNYKAFILYHGPGGPAAVFSDISEWINPARVAIMSVQSLIVDGMLIYRCWVLNGHSWLVVTVPIAMWLGDVVCTIRMIQLESSIHSQALVLNEAIEPYAITFWSLTLAINLITNYFIVSRIWRVNSELNVGRAVEVPGRVSLHQLMRVIIESGLLCTISSFLTLIVYASHSTLIYVTTNVEVHLLAVAFDLIIIRVARAKQAKGESVILPSIHFAQGGSLGSVRGTAATLELVVIDTVDSRFGESTGRAKAGPRA